MTEEFCYNIEDHAVEGTIYDDIEEATVRNHSLNIFSQSQFNLNGKLSVGLKSVSFIDKEGTI